MGLLKLSTLLNRVFRKLQGSEKLKVIFILIFVIVELDNLAGKKSFM